MLATQILSNRYWTGLYNRFNEAAHPRELVEEKVSCVTQQNVCLDSHISHITKVRISWISGSSYIRLPSIVLCLQ